MSVHLTDLVWRHSSHKGGELLVLLAIADNADFETGQAYPSIEHIAQKTRLSKGGVHAILKRILGGDEVEIIKRGAKGRATLYRICVKALRNKPDRLVQSLNSRLGYVQSEGEISSPAGGHQPSVEPSGKKTASSSTISKERTQDLLWERLLSECGIDADALTKSGRGSANAALKQIRDVGATPDEITRRSAMFRGRYAGVTLTPTALAKHWGMLGPRGSRSNGVDPLAHMRLPEGEKA